jgi:phosphoribosylanthranilate isomerase
LTRVKVCGITTPAEARDATAGGADVVGFVLVEGSRHQISPEAARAIAKSIPVFVKTTAVMAPSTVGEAVGLARRSGADVLQIHGTLESDEIRGLKKRVHQAVVTTVAAGSDDAYDMDGIADAVLIDTFKDGTLGGTGAVHDWTLSAKLAKDLTGPVILAGGLNPSNVAEAIRTVNPYAVDVSSGVEIKGKKDLAVIKSFVKEVKSCQPF